MYCFNLNLNIRPLKFDIDLPASAPSGKTNYAETFSLNDVNPELIDILDSRDITVTWVEIFHKYNGMGCWEQIHIDEFQGNFAKLNWVYGGADSYMCWFKQKSNVNKQIKHNEIAGPYIGFNINEVDLVHKELLQGPCVIQAGSPHNVIMGAEHRHALSMVLVDKRSSVRKRLPIEEAYDRLKEYTVGAG